MHLLIRPDGRVHLQTPAAKDFYRPSIDIAMASAAEAYGAAAVGVVLTGIGNDGSEGLKQIRDAGGEGFVQDVASCIVPSMPERALQHAGADRRRQPGAARSGPVFAEETVVTGDRGTRVLLGGRQAVRAPRGRRAPDRPRREDAHGGRQRRHASARSNLAGQAVPVFRLGSVLGRTGVQRNTPTSGGHHIAVTGEDGELVGWLVDRVVRTPLSQDAQIVALPAVVGPAATSWFEALVKVGGTSILLLAPQSLNPLSSRQPRASAIGSSAAPAVKKPGDSAEQIVLLFSTPALAAMRGAALCA